MSTALPLTKPCPPSCVEALPCEVTVFGMGLQGDAGPESPGGPNPTGQDSAFQGVQRGRSGESSAGRGWRERLEGEACQHCPPARPPSGPGSKQACCVCPPSCRSLAHAEPRRNLNETPHQGGICLYFSSASLCAKSNSSAVSGLAAPSFPHPV